MADTDPQRGPEDDPERDPGTATPADEDAERVRAADVRQQQRADEAAEDPERTRVIETAPDDDAEGRHAAEPTPQDEAAEDRAADRALAERREETGAPVAAEEQPVLEPARESAPVAPKREGNRLVGTAWALLAAGLFQVVYFAALAGLIALLVLPQAGWAQVGPVVSAQLQQYLGSAFAWLPVLFFFLLFELAVLLFDRAGRFFYVVSSLVVGVVTYVASVLLISILTRGSIGDTATLEQTFLVPQFILVGLVAREVMLWTGVAIGARGTRVRKRNRAAQQAYRDELAER
ncbi:hypothetical protein [Amnibacterium endophyticum]|uniref:Uncharacterized protein n=1 Tax=Amnibacterium endophyticum TaxID=2109337 RepID=A0ABW4LCW1_9MICO